MHKILLTFACMLAIAGCQKRTEYNNNNAGDDGLSAFTLAERQHRQWPKPTPAQNDD